MIVDQRDELWWFKLNGLLRHAIVCGANPFAQPIVLTEYPKSGGTWMSQMLSASLDLPYPRNRLPTWKSQIIHGCYLNVSSKVKTIVVWRDGRDTMVSYYYHSMFDKPITSAKAGKKLRQHLGVTDPHNVKDMLPRFIEWAFNGGYPRFTWVDFVNKWYDKKGVVFTSYEAVKANPELELRRVLDFIDLNRLSGSEISEIVERYSFKNQSNRNPGDEDVTSFVRKGVVGDWKNTFNIEAREMFHHYAGTELQLLGYENDDSWVGRMPGISALEK